MTTEAQRRAQAERSRKGGLAKAAKVRGLKELAAQALIKDAERRLSGCRHRRVDPSMSGKSYCQMCKQEVRPVMNPEGRWGVDWEVVNP